MGRFRELAQNVEDLFYQDFKSAEDFFTKYHFRYLCSVLYADILQAEYEKSYKKNLAETGIGKCELNPEWFIAEEVEVQYTGEQASLKPKSKPFSFRFDRSASGISTITTTNDKCGDFVRISHDEIWKLKGLPINKYNFFYLLGSRIYFANLKCKPKSLTLIYIPAIDSKSENDYEIADAIQFEILAKAHGMMVQASQGKVIDVTADQNPNKTIETELNTAFRNIKTRP